jgi:hypothetical protein
MHDFSFTAHIFKEGATYVAYVPALDLSSCGATDEDARRNIRDAVRAFLKTSVEMGTLDEILEEGSYQRESDNWNPPRICCGGPLNDKKPAKGGAQNNAHDLCRRSNR